MIPIKGVKPQKLGNSHYFLIPAQYVSNKLISCIKIYDIEIHEKKQKTVKKE